MVTFMEDKLHHICHLLRLQMAAALAQPLPKGWVPHPHPQTGQPCFLDTRTGAEWVRHLAHLQSPTHQSHPVTIATSVLRQPFICYTPYEVLRQ
jgi:hypothetical protein